MDARLVGKRAPPFEEEMLGQLAGRRNRDAWVVASALAAALPPSLDDRARAIADRSAPRNGEPAWIDGIGLAVPEQAWLACDVFGDQDAVIIAFRDPAGATPRHRHPHRPQLDGQAKDLWLGDDVDAVVAAWSSAEDEHMRTVPIDPRRRGAGQRRSGRRRVGRVERRPGPPHGGLRAPPSDGLGAAAPRRARSRPCRRRTHAPVAGRTRRAGTRFPRLTEWTGCHGPRRSAGRSALAEAIVDLRSDHEGRPLRWSPIVVEMLLADLAPHKLLVDADQAALLPDVVREFVRYAAARTGLADGFVQEILQAVDVHEKQYCDLMADPSAGGPAKAVLSALLARGVPLDDPEACEEALDDLRGAPLPWAPERPSVTTAPADVLKSAAQAPVLARFEALVAFYGQGRKLTAAGQPTLADARQLVGLLGTADRIDPEYGGKVSKTRSATQLREFDFTVRWAVAAGALRRQGNKLVATAAWADLADQPLARWLRAVDALSLLGPLHSRYATRLGGFQELAAFVDTTVPELLDELLERPIPFDTLLENLCENADDEFDWSSPYWNDAEFRRETFRHDLDMLLVILQWGGVTNRTGGAGPGQVALGGHAAVRRVGAADGGRPVVARRGVTGLDAIVWSDFL